MTLPATVTVTFDINHSTVDAAWQAVDNATEALGRCELVEGGALVVESDKGDGVSGNFELRRIGAIQGARAFGALVRAQLPLGARVTVTHPLAGRTVRS